MKSMTVRQRIFRSYSILFIVALMLTVLLSQSVIRNVFKDSILQSYQRELVYTTNRLQTRIDHVKDYQRSVALDEVIMDTFSRYPKVLESESDIFTMNRIMRQRVTTIIGTNQEIYLYVFITLGGTILSFSDDYSLQKSAAEFLGFDYFLENNSDRGIVLSGPFEIEQINGEQFRFFVLSKQVVDLYTLEPLGYVAFILEEEFFSDIFEENMPLEMQTDFYMISEDMQILSASKKETVGNNLQNMQELSEEKLQQLYENGLCEVKNEDGVWLYTLTHMPDSEWSVVHVTSMDALMRSQTVVLWVVIIIGIMVCGVSMAFSRMIANRITDPIVELSRRMANYHSREENGEVTPYVSCDEIANLYSAFDRMVDKSDQLMKQIYVEQEEKSNYQFQLLQAQIRPHFLYNTLEMIKSLVDCQMYEEAGRAIMAVSRFYRLSLNFGNDITSVAQEMDLARQYLYIQRLRYAEYMDYSVAECDGLEKYAIPKLILQPLLENAIYHGIKEKEEKGKIELTIQESEKDLIFTVSDNGAGISPITLKQLRDSLKISEKKNADSFGLYSINRRVQIFFGEKYGLDIESEQFVFTNVSVTIPKINLNDFRGNGSVLKENK